MLVQPWASRQVKQAGLTGSAGSSGSAGTSGTVVNSFNITGTVTAATGYYKIPVSYITGVLPSNSDKLVIQFSRTGDVGTSGTSGTNGTSGTSGPLNVTGGSTGSVLLYTGGTDVLSASLGLNYANNVLQVSASNSSFTSSVDISGSLDISGSITGSSYTGSFTGSFLGNLIGTASIADTASFVSRAEGADDLFITVKNNQATTILKGQTLQAIGVTGENLNVITASNASSANMPAVAIANENITSNAAGTAIIAGRIIGVNTDTFTAGDNVYVNTNGGFTQTKPTGTSLIQNIGVVAKVDASDGEIVVLGSGRSNDIPNITAGYAWVGNENQVATAISTGSLNVATAVTASHVVTASFADRAISSSISDNISQLATASFADTATSASIANNISQLATASFADSSTSSSFALTGHGVFSGSFSGSLIQATSASFSDVTAGSITETSAERFKTNIQSLER